MRERQLTSDGVSAIIKKEITRILQRTHQTRNPIGSHYLPMGFLFPFGSCVYTG